MKIIACSLFLFLICSIPSAYSQQATSASPLVTLNGYTFKEAETMVKNFRDSQVSSHSRSSFWFSKAWVNNLAKILPAEKIDGIRIYFSKDRGANNLVIVATRARKDVFSFTSPYFKPGAAELRGMVENNAPEARLFDVANGDCSGIVCSDSKHVLSCADGKKLISAVGTGEIKTTSVWYPIDLILHLSNELNTAKKAGEETDGIRIYNAKKSADAHTFVIATTRIYQGKSRTDYYECSTILKKNGEGEDGDDGDDGGGMVYDNGEECPNICNDLTWP